MLWRRRLLNYLFTFLFYQTFFRAASATSAVCSSRCYCSQDSSTVRCNHLNLTSVPGVPNRTHTLLHGSGDSLRIDWLGKLRAASCNETAATEAQGGVGVAGGLGGAAPLEGWHDVKAASKQAKEAKDLRFNAIEDIPPATFGGLANLTTLLLNNNHLTVIRGGLFQGLGRLRHLYLYRNRIQQIDAHAFSGLRKLQQLYLHVNEISGFWPETFSNLPKLERLFLHNNRIKRVEPGSFSGLGSLKRLRLDSNPLECDCTILWLVDDLAVRPRVDFSATCYSPSSLTGAALLSIDKLHFQCEKPIIVKEPEDTIVPYGSDATLTCQATGDPEPEVIWMRDSSHLTDNSRYVMLDNGTLMIRSSDQSDDGYFECIAINSMGSAKSRAARMLVKREIPEFEAPEFSVKPENVRAKLEDSQLILHCLVKGRPKPHVHWYHDKKRMLLTERISMYHNGTIVIQKVTTEDAGVYTCHGQNIHGKVMASATVEITSPPNFLVTPGNKTVVLGERVNLICKARGIPMPKVTWYKDVDILEPSANIVFNQDSTILTIEEITEADADIYFCKADNEEGYIETVFNIELDNEIDTGPRLIQKPYNIDANLGSSVEIPCKSSDVSTTTTEWRKDGSSLTLNARIKISSIGSLIIYNLSIADGGRYECSVVNEYGRDTASGVLTILENTLPGDQFVKTAITQAVDDVDLAITNTIDALLNKKDHIDPFRAVRYPEGPALAVARSAEIYERALALIREKVDEGMKVYSPAKFDFKNILSPHQIDLIAQLSGCTAHRAPRDCSDICYHNKYRSIDGSCNNFKQTTWGSSLTGFRRVLLPIYENGFNLPVGWSKNIKYNGYTLPSARQISTELISTKEITEDNRITHMVMQWGQFLDHDLDHALPSVSSQSWDGIDCKKSCAFAPPCFPMEVPPNDTRISNRRCIDFIRTSAVCGSGMTSIFFNEIQPREQVNQLTSFIDGSQIYGFSSELSNDLRDFVTDDGNLRVGPTFEGRKPLLPFAGNQGVDCRRDLLESNVNCFVAGDIRVNEQIGLTAMHTIWMREHNRLTKNLKKYNPFWDGETLYQEARKIIGAQIQFITYEKWLPIILGPEGMDQLGHYQKYDSKVNPSISNVFATAALRFGHTLINPVLHRYDENFEPIPQGHLELHNAFFAPWRLIEEGGVDPLFRGMFMTPAKLKTPDQNLNDELTEKLFHSAHAVALDLAAMNIQRARDHAIPSYIEWRRFCNMSEVADFEDLKNEISNPQIRMKLQELYGSPRNIDIFVGGILEDQVEGGKVGPLFRCILIEQFKRLRDGDRLWYENPTTFKPQQLQQIKETSLARIICDNGDNIDTISEDVFLLPEFQDGLLDCEDVPSMDLMFWADCQDCIDNDITGEGRSKRNTPDAAPVEQISSTLGQLQKSYKEFEEKIENLQKRIDVLEKQCPVN